MTVLSIICIVYCIGALLTFIVGGYVSGSFKDGIFGIIFAAAFAFFWFYTIPAMFYEEYGREQRKKRRKK
ncbi:hypothetical protein pEaSNUABM50_00081 [Erwinia phage pEa_SNUABM_50]|uniref:Uncharacterized protein n=3 Tax=Eneladusvirus BF TaxID=2560751 RepID=A0A7L8ZNQ7_9CAUD|nr:membrane protein [Serratia phage BF]QOI71021.1 putative membrane protein [Erwinia phage pEa_SNUABM_12]QOI72105.1 hypothetical protein pEaSNUABM50_00081 [Erwinia phage pEa_SNUABM_50]QXO11230.1 hypothetical protein pEaSNUABM19_00084 [Erwinia phage pEa_SNUABM_19]QXO11778.1 hypothetical protein pEaSNUABM44_00082 [Erwinia phage pEa_SNUABM_44]AQW88608.1 hypothetical protein BF_0083 [Serratia phage BF]